MQGLHEYLAVPLVIKGSGQKPTVCREFTSDTVCTRVMSITSAQRSSLGYAHVKALIDDCLQGRLVSAMEQQALIVPLVPMLGAQLPLPQCIPLPQHLVLHSLYASDILRPALSPESLQLKGSVTGNTSQHCHPSKILYCQPVSI